MCHHSILTVKLGPLHCFPVYGNSGTTSFSQLVRDTGSWCHMLLWCLFVGQVEEQYAGEGADQEDHIKPAVVEVELKLSEDFCDDGAVF